MNLDLDLFRLFNDLARQSAFADAAYIFLGLYLIYIILLAVLAFWFLWKRTWSQKLKAATIFLILAAVSYALVFFVVHPLWPRERPFEALLNVNQLVPETGLSFPSKHALIAFLSATFIFGFNKKVGFWFFVAASLVAIGRVFVGVHYPLDVLAGGVLGILIGWVGVWVFKKLKF